MGCALLGGAQAAVVWSEERGSDWVADVLLRLGLDELDGWRLTCTTDVSASGRVLAGVGRGPDDEPGAWIARLP